MSGASVLLSPSHSACFCACLWVWHVVLPSDSISQFTSSESSHQHAVFRLVFHSQIVHTTLLVTSLNFDLVVHAKSLWLISHAGLPAFHKTLYSLPAHHSVIFSTSISQSSLIFCSVDFNSAFGSEFFTGHRRTKRACVCMSCSPFDGKRQVLHLWVLLFDLFGEVKDDFLKLRNQSGLSQTDVLVQGCCLLMPARKSGHTSALWRRETITRLNNQKNPHRKLAKTSGMAKWRK